MRFQVVALLLVQCGLFVNAAPSASEVAPVAPLAVKRDDPTPSNETKFEIGNPADLPVASMEWEGPIVEGGKNETIHGTAERVWGVLVRNNASVTLEGRELSSGSSSPLVTREDNPLSKRTPISHHDCDGGLIPAFTHPTWSGNTRPVEDAIRHLKNIGGNCGCPPRTCCRISCSWDVGVHMCNYNDYHIAPACWDLGAWFVQHLNNHCTRMAIVWPRGGYQQVCGGRVFPNQGAGTGWDVHLDEQRC